MRKPRILLVDDYRDALEMWGFYLKSCGYDIVTATDGLEAVAAAKDARPDLIVLDLDLPGISGLEAGRRIRSCPATSHIPLIAATGVSHSEGLNEARLAGFEAVLIKPCEPAALLQQIEKSLAGASGQTAAANA